MISVYIVEDHSVVRHGIAHIVNSQGDMVICGEADCIQTAKTQLDDLRPDVVLVDISIKQESGMELIKDIALKYPDILVLVVTMHDQISYIQHCLRAGSKGYFHKDDSVHNIPNAIRKIVEGELYVSPQITQKMLHLMTFQSSENQVLSALSKREIQVLDCLGAGFRRQQIADRLCISAKTVSSHIENIKIKLQLPTSDDVCVYAIQRKKSALHDEVMDL